MPTQRKVGQRKESFDDETLAKSLTEIKKFVRLDFGGQPDHIGQIKKKMAQKGIDCGDKSAEAILELIREVLEGVKKRQAPRLDYWIGKSSPNSFAESLP